MLALLLSLAPAVASSADGIAAGYHNDVGIETNAAVQRVERFATGSGPNNLELGFRLRYEIWRKFGPYVGVSFDWSLFSTADLVRQNGGDPNQTRFVAGARVWR